MVMHFSIDDFIDALTGLKEAKYQSIFEQPIFAVLRRVHKECGAVFSCYCFYENENGSLEEVPSAYAEEFQENAHWLRFGFHGLNPDSNYGSTKFKAGNWIDDGNIALLHYTKVMEQLVRITGGGECIDRFPRVHYYAGTIIDCKAWKGAEYGICGLITAEDERVCYYHDEVQWKELINHGSYFDEQLNIGFWRTCIRLENMQDAAMLEAALDSINSKQDYLIFTHEKFLEEKRIEAYFVKCGEYAEQNNLQLGYFYHGK